MQSYTTHCDSILSLPWFFFFNHLFLLRLNNSILAALSRNDEKQISYIAFHGIMYIGIHVILAFLSCFNKCAYMYVTNETICNIKGSESYESPSGFTHRIFCTFFYHVQLLTNASYEARVLRKSCCTSTCYRYGSGTTEYFTVTTYRVCGTPSPWFGGYSSTTPVFFLFFFLFFLLLLFGLFFYVLDA